MCPFFGGGGGGDIPGTFAIGPNYGDGSPTLTLSVGTVSLTAVTTEVLASKDSWVDTVAGCVANSNHDATNLAIDGIAATSKVPIVGWNLASYPSGATVSAATLSYYLVDAPTVSNGVQLFHISDANEATWAEGAVTCSNVPANSGSTFDTIPTGDQASAGAKTFTLGSTSRTRISDRMGVGNYSIKFVTGATGTRSNLQSKDSGGSPGNGSGPRLSISWSKTL